MGFKTYYDMGRIEQLPNSGRELIGKTLLITVKRDGQNICFYKNPNSDMINIASHHQAIAVDSIRENVKATKEYPKILEMFEESDKRFIYVEHISKGKGATRIEKPKKHGFLVLLDIFDTNMGKSGRYLSYNYIHQMAHKYKVPIVKLLDEIRPTNMEELWRIRNDWLVWCSKHFREGIVVKDYYSKYQIFVKEKTDLPKLKKNPRCRIHPYLPIMPEEKMLSAVEQGMAEVIRNELDPKDPKVAMPILARYVATECREHCYQPPRNFYGYYMDYLREHGDE